MNVILDIRYIIFHTIFTSALFFKLGVGLNKIKNGGGAE